MKQYFILVHGKSEGPYAEEDLLYQNINHETLVWFEGLPTWQKAGTFPQLAKSLPPAAVTSSIYQSEWIKRTSFIIMAVIITLLIAVISFNKLNSKKALSEREAIEQAKIDQKEYEKAYTKAHIDELVHVKNSSYTYRLIGGISGLKVTVVNSSEFDMDLVLVNVTYLKDNGGIYKTEMLQFNNLKSHTSLTQHAPESKRGTQVESSIVQVKSTGVGL